MTVETSRRERYLFIDGLRGIAIVWVLLHHAFYFFDVYRLLPPHHFLFRLAKVGLLGVDLFFVISGFLITGILIDGQTAAPNIGRFYGRRFLKIYPQYLCAFLFCLALPWLVPSVLPVSARAIQLDTVGRHLLLVQNYFGLMIETFGHSWSLAVEEHFYLVFPLIVWVIVRWLPVRVWRIVLGVVLVALIGLVVENRVVSNGMDALCRLTFPPDPAQATLIRIDAILAGCCLKVMEPLLRRIPRAAGILFAGGGMWGYSLLFQTLGDRLTVAAILWGWVSAVMIMAAGYVRLWGLCHVLEFGWLRWIGRNSYGIYLWHYPLIFVFLIFKTAVPSPVLAMAFMGSAIGVGALATATVERFFLALRQRWVP
jgi:peptidoglycan/LPS O-acetylase OafA/YrhL